jgi:hypothetical protein
MVRGLIALSAVITAAGCRAKAPAIAEPVEGVPLAQQRTIDRNELDFKWPFEAGSGTIACDGGALFFRTGGTTYALSRSAGTRGYGNIDAIRRTQSSGPPSDPVSRLTQEARLKVFAQAADCGSPSSTVGTASVEACRARIQERNGLTAEELTKIEAEGVERNWPPRRPQLMSVDPVIEAARGLCPR